jgi:hypothetical protein
MSSTVSTACRVSIIGMQATVSFAVLAYSAPWRAAATSGPKLRAPTGA